MIVPNKLGKVITNILEVFHLVGADLMLAAICDMLEYKVGDILEYQKDELLQKNIKVSCCHFMSNMI